MSVMGEASEPGPRNLPEPPRPVATGGLIVLFAEGTKPTNAIQTLQKTTGIRALVASEFVGKPEALESEMRADAAVVIPTFGVAVLPASEPSRMARSQAVLMAASDVRQVRPEFYLFSIAGPPYQDTTDHTWGIEATGAAVSPYTGQGIRVAVLDTGFAFDHPDFSGRAIASQSFVPGETADDVQGHGTHCAGTVCGPGANQDHPRYGVAPDAELFVGKVLNNRGSGMERWILAGMEWAVQQKCSVISMSLGRATRPGEAPDPVYENAGQVALSNKCLIIAAAGNESARQYGYIAPVGSPANSPSIVAVGALDPALQVAEFSCGGINPGGGEVDVAAPGVGVFSSVPLPRRYMRLAGTSMACPHVAGIAALWAESDPSLRGTALRDALVRTAQTLPLPARDVGAGLVQAPRALVA